MKIPKTILLLAVAAALTTAGQVSANYITNPGFEDPIGSEWTFTRVSGTATKWSSGVSSTSVHSGAKSYGMSFGPVAELGEAYVSQVVSGLTPGVSYDISGWINLNWRATKATAFIQVLGGGDPVQAPVEGGNTDNTWQEWALAQTADSSGNLTVRLYLDKRATTTADKTCIAYFDDIMVVIPEPAVAVLLALGSVVMVRRRRT